MKKKKKNRNIWVYKGVIIHPADLNASGIKWWALKPNGTLRSNTKAGMRDLINGY